MASRRPVGHVREHGPGRWRLYAEAAPDPVSGRRRQRSRVVEAANRREALGLLAGFVAELAAEDPGPGGRPLTVDELLDRWLAHARSNVEANTWHEWASALDRYVRSRIGDRPIAEVTTFNLDQLYAELLAGGGRDGRPLSASTVRKVHTPLRMAFAQAVRWSTWSGIRTNPAVDVTLPSEPKRRVAPPDEREAGLLLARAERDDPDFAALVRLGAATGARRGEVVGLQWSDVDLEAGTVVFARVVIRAGKTYEVREYPKTSDSRRRVAIGASTTAALRGVRARAAERAMALGVKPGPWVFSPDPANGRHHTLGVVSHRFRRLQKRAGLTGVRLHDLRHFMATQALGAGVDVRTVAGRGGWSNPTTLLKTYAHWLPAKDQAAAGALDELLDGAPSTTTENETGT